MYNFAKIIVDYIIISTYLRIINIIIKKVYLKVD